MTADDEPTIHIDQSVRSEHQHGGITAHTVHISAPQPSVSIEIVDENMQTDDGYQTTVAIHVDTPYAAKNLAILVNRPSLKGFGVNRVDPAASLSTARIAFDGGQGVLVAPPLTTDYRAFIVTESLDPDIAIEAQLNVDVAN